MAPSSLHFCVACFLSFVSPDRVIFECSGNNSSNGGWNYFYSQLTALSSFSAQSFCRQACSSVAIRKSSSSLKHGTSSVGKPWCQGFHCANNHIFCIKHELFKFLSTNFFLNVEIPRVGIAMVTARNLSAVVVS